MNNKQQTAVDFFYDEVWACFSSNLSWSECELLKKIKDQSKEMEKEKAIKLYIDYENYLHEEFKHQNGGQAVILSFREFYEQTCGGNK